MKNLSLLNFLLILSLVDLTCKLGAIDRVGDIGAKDIISTVANNTGNTRSAEIASCGFAGTISRRDTSTWGCHFKATAGDRVADASSESCVIDFGPHRAVSPAGSADGAKDLVSTTGRVTGLSDLVRNLTAEPMRVRRGGASVFGSGSAPGVVEAAASAPALAVDNNPVLLLASAIERSSGFLAQQAQAATIANQLLEQKLKEHAQELAEDKRAKAAERAAKLAEKAAYASRSWYRRAEARAECFNFTAVLCSAAAGATAVAALYYQNNPQ